MIAVFAAIAIIILFVGIVGAVSLIDMPRKPITRNDAAGMICLNTFLICVIIALAIT